MAIILQSDPWPFFLILLIAQYQRELIIIPLKIIKMIYYIQRKKYKATTLDLALATLLFLSITFFFFYSFADICFSTINRLIPNPVLGFLIAYMVIDIIYGLVRLPNFFKRAIFNIIITILVAISWISQNNYVQFLGAAIFLRIPEIYICYVLIHQRLRPYYIAYRVFIILKIFYLMMVVGHILGCIFYAIDITLIQEQRFMAYSENPNLYYQGSLTAFTPIYGLPQIQRYVYAMYYIVSLISTVAYGDIIPKNYIQDAYVILLLILATITISLIIEEMIILFRTKKNNFNLIIKKVKFFNQLLKQFDIAPQKRHNLNRYMTESMWKDFETPKIHKLTSIMRKRLRLETICDRCLSQQQKQQLKNDAELAQKYLTKHLCLTPILTLHILHLMDSITLPPGLIFIENDNTFNKMTFHIMIAGKISVGYTHSLFAKKKYKKQPEINSKSDIVMLGWTELLWNTRSVNPHLRAQTNRVTEFYSLHEDKFKSIVAEYRLDWKNKGSHQIELVNLAKEEQLFNNKKQCTICSKKGHTALNCQACHLSINPSKEIPHRTNPRKQLNSPRKKYKAPKIHTRPSTLSLKIQQNEFSVKLREKYQQTKSKRNNKHKQTIQKLEQFKVFHPEYNLQQN